jgi:hypothetical protein
MGGGGVWYGALERGGGGRAAGNDACLVKAGGGLDRGGAPGSGTGRRKSRCVGYAWWMADGPAALGWPEVNSIFSDFFKWN